VYRLRTSASCGGGIPGPHEHETEPHISQVTTDDLLVRFVLDHDVDVRVGVVLRQAGHECWPSTAGLAASADDDAVASYADDRGRC
jgi:hypothetical protein